MRKNGLKLLDMKTWNAETRHRNDWRKKRREEDREEKSCKMLLHLHTTELVLFASTSWPKTRSTHPAFQRVPGVDADKSHPSNKINTYQIAEARNYTTHFSIFLERVI